MQCELCNLEASYRVWKYALCKPHYEDLEVYLRKHPSLVTVRYFVKTNGTMKEENRLKTFYDKHVEKL